MDYIQKNKAEDLIELLKLNNYKFFEIIKILFVFKIIQFLNNKFHSKINF